MTTLEIIELIAIIVVGVGLGIIYLIKAIKNKWVDKIKKAIKEGIRDAEKSGLKNKAKLDYVLKYVRLICDEEGIPFEAIKKLVTKLINTFVEGHNTFIDEKKD